MQLSPYMNNGRWLMDCPKCGTPLPCWEAGVVCPRCHPDILARALRPLKNGDLRPVPDIELIEAARAKAREADEEYTPIYPAEKHEIEEILRLRPGPENMNWVPEETLADLRAQNLEHGDPVPQEKK